MKIKKKILKFYKDCKYSKLIIILFLLAIVFFTYKYNIIKEAQEIERIKQEKIELEQKKLLEKQKEELRKKLEKQSYIDNLDLETDSSLTKFVSSDVSFTDKWYVPEKLEKIASEHIYDAKWWYQLVRKEAQVALEKMATNFMREFEKPIVVISAYRSYNYQKGIKNRGCPDNLCAKAGYSEHQSGLAVDLWETTTNKQFLSQARLKKYFEWLQNNAHLYWFHNTYQKGLEIDTYEIEPWHWRYMWVELASYLKEKDLTFAEYYKKIH